MPTKLLDKIKYISIINPNFRNQKSMGTDREEPGATSAVDAEFIEAPAPSGTTGEALVVSTQGGLQKIETLARALENSDVSPEVRQELIELAQISVGAVERVVALERRFDEFVRSMGTRGDILAVTSVPGAAAERAPDKLRALKIGTPETVALAEERFLITVENTNGEEVNADVQIVFSNLVDKEDPVLAAVVNGKEDRSGAFTQRPITLGPGENRTIEVKLRSKLGKDGDTSVRDIIAERLKITVTLKPTDVDSSLSERVFPVVQRDVNINDTVPYEAEAHAQAGKQYYGFGYPQSYNLVVLHNLQIAGIEWRYRGGGVKEPWGPKTRLLGTVAATRLGTTYQETFESGFMRAQARTCKGFLPVNVAAKVTLHLDKEIGPEFK